jgi:hypothetical protein
MIDKEKLIITLIRDLELKHKASSIREAEVIHAVITRDLSDTNANAEVYISAATAAFAAWNIKFIINELVTVGVLYRPAKGMIARVEKEQKGKGKQK